MDIYPVPLTAEYSSISSSCLYCRVWGGLSVFCGSLWSSLYCGDSSLWMELYRWLVKVSWLRKLGQCSGGWSWISSLWSAMKCPVMSYEISVVLEQLWTACILELRDVFLYCWIICMVCLALELVGPWVVLGFSVGMEAFDKLLSINVPWSQEFSGALRVWT